MARKSSQTELRTTKSSKKRASGDQGPPAPSLVIGSASHGAMDAESELALYTQQNALMGPLNTRSGSDTTSPVNTSAFDSPLSSPRLIPQEVAQHTQAPVDSTSQTQPKKARKSRPRLPRKSPLQALEEERLRLEAKSARDSQKAAKRVEDRTTREAKKWVQKQADDQEILELKAAKPPKPVKWELQLTTPPPCQNISGRTIRLPLVPHDDSFPLTPATREQFVEQVLDAMRDVREAEDTISTTTDFKTIWLKPGLDQKFFYNETDMERVCRELVSIAETLHTEGLGPTRIYCPRTIQKAQDAKPMPFRNRIDKLSNLMRKSKARCNDFMLGNTMEDTIALVEEKLAARDSNAKNNKTRSEKLEATNQMWGLEKGAKWSRTDETATASFLTAGATPESLSSSYGTFAGPAGFHDVHDLPLNAFAEFASGFPFTWQNHGSSYGVGGSWNNSFQPGPDSRNPQDWPLSNDPPSFGDSFGQS